MEQAKVPSQAPVRAAEANHAMHRSSVHLAALKRFCVLESATTLTESVSILNNHKSGRGPSAPHCLKSLTQHFTKGMSQTDNVKGP